MAKLTDKQEISEGPFKHSRKKELEDDFISDGFNLDDTFDTSFNFSEEFKHKLNFDSGASNIKRLPKIGHSIHIVTQKSINSFDFILKILEQEVIEEMYLSFYRIGKKTTHQLIELVNYAKIKNLTVIINDGFKKLIPNVYNLLYNSKEEIQLKECHNHTKIIVAKTEYNHYIIEGSGNLSRNARIEQYAFINSSDLYEFHKKWMEEI